jgi:hypothetical protein
MFPDGLILEIEEPPKGLVIMRLKDRDLNKTTTHEAKLREIHWLAATPTFMCFECFINKEAKERQLQVLEEFKKSYPAIDNSECPAVNASHPSW